MSTFSHAEFDNHEHVSFFCDAHAGLRAIVAIHTSSALGIAGGGCRMWPYASDDDALYDVLRLSKAMSYKLVLAGLPAGGAKCVVIADPRTEKTPDLLRALGTAVQRLGGRYVIAEDVGTTPADMDIIAKETPYVAGRSGDSGDTTAPTAYGTFTALRCAVHRRLGRADLKGLRIAIQGVGGVGFKLGELLVEAGCRLVVCDVDQKATTKAREALGAEVVTPDAIFDVPADVFAPCALGAVLDESTLSRLKCAVVAGAANNQLARDDMADRLQDRDILYAPDFITNMGGVLGAARSTKATKEQMQVSMQRIETVLNRCFDRAREDQVSPNAAAIAMAREALDERREPTRGEALMASLWRMPWVARSALKLRDAWPRTKEPNHSKAREAPTDHRETNREHR